MNAASDSDAVRKSGARPLAGLRVLDFGQFIAGPVCATMRADYGADVIRIERPGGANDRTVQHVGDDGVGGAFYRQYNRGKRSLALDPFDPASRPLVDALLARSDVVIANVPAPTLAARGLDDPLLATDALRGRRNSALSAILGAWCAARSSADCLAAFRQAKLPAAAVLTTAQVMTDPETRRPDFWAEDIDPSMPLARNPVRLMRTPAADPARAPALDADGATIRSEVGFD